MSASTRLLLRLPPCLRRQVFALDSFPPNARHTAVEGFQTQISTSARTYARNALAKPRMRPPPATKSSAPIPRPRPTLSGGRNFIQDYQTALERVLIYEAPKHGTFFAASYLIGGITIIGGVLYADMFLKNRSNQQVSYLVKCIGAISTLFVVGFGAVWMTAPLGMIKSISIVSAKATANGMPNSAPRMLRIEIKRLLPFLKPEILDTTPQKVFVNRNLRTMADDISVRLIPKTETEAFTERYFSNVKEKTKGSGVMGALKSFNQSLLHTWPAIRRETRRMFLRDQMAYLEVTGTGKFKLDLQNCSLLDNGTPLFSLVGTDPSARPSLVSKLRQIFKG